MRRYLHTHEVNRGWALLPLDGDSWLFASSEREAVQERPRLVIEWDRKFAEFVAAARPGPNATPNETTAHLLERPRTTSADPFAVEKIALPFLQRLR